MAALIGLNPSWRLNMKNLVTLMLLVTPTFSLAASPNNFSFECVFDKHYAAYLNEDKTEKFQKGETRMTIISGRTSGSTWDLDGSIRATNSNTWRLVASDGLGGRYIGDDGDLLTIIYNPEDGYGEYIASLQWSNSLGYAFSDIGVCTGTP